MIAHKRCLFSCCPPESVLDIDHHGCSVRRWFLTRAQMGLATFAKNNLFNLFRQFWVTLWSPRNVFKEMPFGRAFSR